MGKKISFIAEHDNKAQTLGEPPTAAERKISDIKIPERKGQEGKSHESKSVAVKSEVRPEEFAKEKSALKAEDSTFSMDSKTAEKILESLDQEIANKHGETPNEKVSDPFSDFAEHVDRVLMNEEAFKAAIDAEYRPIHGPIFNALGKISEPLAEPPNKTSEQKDFEPLAEQFASLGENVED